MKVRKELSTTPHYQDRGAPAVQVSTRARICINGRLLRIEELVNCTRIELSENTQKFGCLTADQQYVLDLIRRALADPV